MTEIKSIHEEILHSIRDSKDRLQKIYEELQGKGEINSSLMQSIENALNHKDVA